MKIYKSAFHATESEEVADLLCKKTDLLLAVRKLEEMITLIERSSEDRPKKPIEELWKELNIK